MLLILLGSAHSSLFVRNWFLQFPNATTGCLIPLQFKNNTLGFTSISPGCNLSVICYRDQLGSVQNEINHLLLLAPGFETKPSDYGHLINAYLVGKKRMLCGIDHNGTFLSDSFIQAHDQLTQGRFYNYLIEYLIDLSSTSQDHFFKNYFDENTKYGIVGFSAGAHPASAATAYASHIDSVVLVDPVDCEFDITFLTDVSFVTSVIPATNLLISAIFASPTRKVKVAVFSADDRLAVAEGRRFSGCYPSDVYKQYQTSFSLIGSQPSGAYATFHKYDGMNHGGTEEDSGVYYPPLDDHDYFTRVVNSHIVLELLPKEL